MKKQSKTAQIRTLLEKGLREKSLSVVQIAKKLGTSPSSVYQVRYQMNKPARLAKFRAQDAARAASDEAFFQEQDRLAALKAKEESVEPVQEPVQPKEYYDGYEQGLRDAGIGQEPVQPDLVNHPKHYKAGGIETIDFIEAKQLGYHLGNVVKYISRARDKGGMEDLLKAQWYLNRAIEKGEVNE